LALLLLSAAVFAARPALASVPPLKVAAARQASLRAEADELGPTDVTITVLGARLRTYRASGATLAASRPLELLSLQTAKAESAEKADKLRIGPDQPLPWSVVYALILARDPVSELQARLGGFDVSHTKIETLDDSFVYVYGDSPQLALSRDFGLIRRVAATVDGVKWEFRLAGELGEAGLPERINILRDGAPFASVELSVHEPA
jgi:hypothetical protein